MSEITFLEAHTKRLKKIDKKFEELAYLVLRQGRAEEMDYETRGAEMNKLASAMTAADRQRFFGHFFPELATHLEDAWLAQGHEPFANSFRGMPFRAPNSRYVWDNCAHGFMELLFDEASPDDTIDALLDRTPTLHRYMQPYFGTIFAAVLERGGPDADRVMQKLVDATQLPIRTQNEPNAESANTMGHHVVTALLGTTRKDAWAVVEQLLLGAQRDEGLRSAILDGAKAARPEAFKHILRVVRDNDLSRFSSVVQWVDEILRLHWAQSKGARGEIQRIITDLATYFDDPKARDEALAGSDAESAYFALWTVAFEDAERAVPIAARLMDHANPEHRYVALRILTQIALPEGRAVMPKAIEDADLRIVRTVTGRDGDGTSVDPGEFLRSDMFERLARRLPTLPKKRTPVEPILWPWTKGVFDRGDAEWMLLCVMGRRPGALLLPLIDDMDPRYRANAIHRLWEDQDSITPEVRAKLLEMMADPSQHARNAALAGLLHFKLHPSESPAMEELLTRKGSEQRAGLIKLLLTLPDADVVAAANRLLASKNKGQKDGGTELLKELKKQGREASSGIGLQPRTPTADFDADPTLDDALGLADNDKRTWAPAPVNRNVKLMTPVRAKLEASLTKLFEQHADRMITHYTELAGQETGTLNDWEFGIPDMSLDVAKDRERLILGDVWEQWWDSRDKSLRDADGMELPRWCWTHQNTWNPDYNLVPEFPRDEEKDGLPQILRSVKRKMIALNAWFIRMRGTTEMVDFVLDAAETVLARVPEKRLLAPQKKTGTIEIGGQIISYDPSDRDWRGGSPLTAWLDVARLFQRFAPGLWTPAQKKRLWLLVRWLDQPIRPAEQGGKKNQQRPITRMHPAPESLLEAFTLGAATEADLYDMLLGARADHGQLASNTRFNELEAFSRRRLPVGFSQYTNLPALVERCRERILEVELARGDTPTVASVPATRLRLIHGVERLGRILTALGDRPFVRNWFWSSGAREEVFSHLTRICFPKEGETAADFARVMKQHEVSDKRQVEVAMYAPQWAPFVESSLKWQGLADAVWWVHAHTKGGDWNVDAEIRKVWEGDLSVRTPLTSEDLLDGAVDVEWFRRSHEQLGAKRWDVLYNAAKYASSGGGHTRARLFADAMLDAVTRKELQTKVKTKRDQDAVRALGLLPLAKGAKKNADVLERYHEIQEFVRGAKQFGSQRQASEKRAAQIGLENLARNAGYPDPIRLQWAMEAKAVEDLADGPISVTVKDVTVSLGIDPFGEVTLTTTKGDKTLADVPAPLKKNPKIDALRKRKTDLKRQASRIRPSLEQLMIRGETFTGAELKELLAHPLLSPMLASLVLIGDGQMGYPVKDGKALEDHSGKVHALGKNETLHIAHPLDLLPAASWTKWQKDCFARERIQPFKQVFRELYPLTAGEREEKLQTSRYAGHQVEPRKALALLGQRGWVHRADEGIRKTFHDIGLVAWLELEESFYTAAEVEGLTIETIRFTKRADGSPVQLKDVPPRHFSEAMRDMDLVVSVAHQAGVDPEASASSIEMRASLVRQACALLRLSNVAIKDRYAIIDGTMARYSVHLGSASVRKLPGDFIIIVAVHSQHRGRLFLPFADNDPRSAELLSKVLLLARDSEIKDPNILDQIRR